MDTLQQPLYVSLDSLANAGSVVDDQLLIAVKTHNEVGE